MKQRRGEYPKGPIERPNGYYYIFYSRTQMKSLKTQDFKEATVFFNTKKAEILAGKVIEIGKISRIKLSEFKGEYLNGSDNIPNRGLHVVPGTIDIDKLAIEKFIEICGDLPLRQVKRKHIGDFKAKCLQLNLTMNVLHYSFSISIPKLVVASCYIQK